MFFTYDITVSAATTAASPKTQRLALSAGKIKLIEIKFPAGCHGLVSVRIMRAGSQIVPLSTGEWITGDNETVNASLNYDLSTPDFAVTFEANSPSATYDHIITVRITIEEIVAPVIVTGDTTEIILLKRICVALNVHDEAWITQVPMPTPTPAPIPAPIPLPQPPLNITLPVDITKPWAGNIHDLFTKSQQFFESADAGARYAWYSQQGLDHINELSNQELEYLAWWIEYSYKYNAINLLTYIDWKAKIKNAGAERGNVND